MFHEKAFGWFISILIGLGFLAAILNMTERRNEEIAENNARRTIVMKGYYEAYLCTVDHDGHKFIVATREARDTGMALIHHPGCSCMKKAEKE